MSEIEKKHWELVQKVGNEWNKLPQEERLRVLCQVKNICKNDMSPNCKRKITEWANNVYDFLKKDFETYQNQQPTNEDKLKAECWEIVVKKCVNISILNGVGEVEQYNQTYVYDNMLNVKWCLTEYEFDLLKRGLEKCIDKTSF